MDRTRQAKLFINFMKRSRLRKETGLEFRLAKDLNEMKQASRIVYKKYVNYLIYENEHKLRFTPQIAYGTGKVFVVAYKGTVLSTLTLVQDSHLGLPMDGNCVNLLKPFREKGRRLAELSMFATDDELLEQTFGSVNQIDRLYLIMYLFRAMMDFNRVNHFADAWVVGVTQHHDFFYENLHFDLIHSVRPYPLGPLIHPFTTRMLDITLQEKVAAPALHQFFNGPVPLKDLERDGINKKYPILSPGDKAFLHKMGNIPLYEKRTEKKKVFTNRVDFLRDEYGLEMDKFTNHDSHAA